MHFKVARASPVTFASLCDGPRFLMCTDEGRYWVTRAGKVHWRRGKKGQGGDCSQYVSLPLFSLLRSFQRHTISENKHQLERNPPFGMVITKGSLNIMTLHHPHLLCVVPRGYRNLTPIFVCAEFRSYKTNFQDSCARVVARYAEFASQSYFVPVSFFSHKSCFSLTIHPMHEFHFSNSRNLPFIFF